MAQRLGDALSETMAGWEAQVPSAWRATVAGVTLDPTAKILDVPHSPWIPIFPTFFDDSDTDRRTLGAPRDSHTFRALQGIRPADVRVVVVGQDPYPDVAKATGQSFEQGDLADWVADAGRVATSLKPILLSGAADETGDSSYLKLNTGWIKLLSKLAAGEIGLLAPNKFFDGLKSQGVLWLNTTLTISLFRSSQGHQEAHAAYWRPFVTRLLEAIAELPGGHGVVFALWGGWAKSLEPAITAHATASGTAAKVLFSKAPHPVTADFLGANPLADVNAKLRQLDQPPVDWLPS